MAEDPDYPVLYRARRRALAAHFRRRFKETKNDPATCDRKAMEQIDLHGGATQHMRYFSGTDPNGDGPLQKLTAFFLKLEW